MIKVDSHTGRSAEGQVDLGVIGEVVVDIVKYLFHFLLWLLHHLLAVVIQHEGKDLFQIGRYEMAQSAMSVADRKKMLKTFFLYVRENYE